MESQQRTWLTIGILALVVVVGVYVVSFGSITGNVVSVESPQIDVIKIGFMGPLTGDAASYGNSIRQGVELAIEDSGLTNIEVIYEDSGCEGTKAVNSINKLISIDGVEAIVGEVCSGATLAISPIAEENSVVLISPSSTSPEITTAGDFIFRTIPTDASQGAFAADLISEDGHETLAILYSNEEYGVGLNDVLTSEFKGSVVANEAFERGASDVRTQLTKIKSVNPDAIYIISNSPDSAVAALRQIQELVVESAIYGSEGLKSPDILESGSAEGLIITSVSAGTDDFALKHMEKFGTEPGPFAAQGYDAFMAIARAIEQGARTGPEIRDALYDIEFEGVSGYIDFDENGDVSGTFNIEQVINNKFINIKSEDFVALSDEDSIDDEDNESMTDDNESITDDGNESEN